ncbi:MAG: hypothetical protein F6K47_07765 [Symploca sp. SIO2E6]|nr:hypothetical protein [Symploca sp. SIO2E6]
MKNPNSTNRLFELDRQLEGHRPSPPPPTETSPSGSGSLFNLEKAVGKPNQPPQPQNHPSPPSPSGSGSLFKLEKAVAEPNQPPQSQNHRLQVCSFDDGSPIKIVTAEDDNSSMEAQAFDFNEPITVQQEDYTEASPWDEDYAKASSWDVDYVDEMATGNVPFQAESDSFEDEEEVYHAADFSSEVSSPHSDALGARLQEIRNEVKQLQWQKQQQPKEQTEAMAAQMKAIREELRSLRNSREAEADALSHEYWEALELEPTFQDFDQKMDEEQSPSLSKAAHYAPVEVVPPEAPHPQAKAMEVELSQQFAEFDRMMDYEQSSTLGWQDGISDSEEQKFVEDLATNNGNYATEFSNHIATYLDLSGYLRDSKHDPRKNKNKLLHMYLDTNRDGKIEVDEPVNSEKNWTTGKEGYGAIIMAKTTLPEPEDISSVPERTPILFEWGGGGYKPQEHTNWEATLSVEPSDKVRIYIDEYKEENKEKFSDGIAQTQIGVQGTSKPVIGLKVGDNFKFYSDQNAHLSLTKNSAVLMWIEAVEYPNAKFDGIVKLNFAFKNNTAQYTETAEVRVAPWIMASDLDWNSTVYLKNTEDNMKLNSSIQKSIEKLTQEAGFECRFLMAKSMKSKGFMRDIMKCGYAIAPHHSQIAVLDNLDKLAQVYNSLSEQEIARKTTSSGAKFELEETKKMSSQNNGGNYLVSPPVDGYPLGRIIYGEGKIRTFKQGHDELEYDEVKSTTCYAAPFLKGQKTQSPVRLDSAWLDVGHVDEFISFVPNKKSFGLDWGYKTLILSPRLAYILAHASASQKVDESVFTIAEQLSKEYRAESFDSLKMKLTKTFGGLTVGNPSFTKERWQTVDYPGYQENPKIPHIGKWNQATVLSWKLQNDLEQKSPQSVKLLDTKSLLEQQDSLFGLQIKFAQPIIDESQKILQKSLKFQGKDLKDEDFIEIPVLLNFEGGGWVGMTVDSVNMLVLNNPNGKCTCIVPKPFGPILNGSYIFEEYIKQKLKILGLTVHFVNDWEGFHKNEGEIHCGTNQITTAPLNPDVQWWEMTKG